MSVPRDKEPGPAVEHYIDAQASPAASIPAAQASERRARRGVFLAGFAAGVACTGAMVWVLRLLAAPGAVVLEGRITAGANAQVIAAPVAGKVQRIAALAGQSVVAGERLLELQSARATSAGVPDVDATAAELATAWLAAARAEALLAALDLNAPPALRDVPGVDAARRAAETRLAQAQVDALKSRLATLDADIAKAEASVAAAREGLAKLVPTHKLASERAQQGKELFDKGFISRNSWTEREQLKTELERDMELARLKLTEAEQAFAAVRERRRGALADERQSLAANLADARRKIAELAPEAGTRANAGTAAKAGAAPEPAPTARIVAAPAAGVIESIDAREGMDVAAGEPLARLRPADAVLEATALAPSDRAGRLAIGQAAMIIAADKARLAARVIAIDPETGGARVRVAAQPGSGDTAFAEGAAVRIEIAR